MQLKLMRLIASAACMAALVLTTASGVAHSQEQAPAVASASETVSPVVPTASKATTATAENPYGLESLWKTSDSVAKAVLLLLVIMSAGSWYILVVKFLEQSKMVRQAKAASKDFWSAGTVEQGAAALETGSPYRFMADSAGRAVAKHEGLRGHVDLNDWIATGIHRAVDRIQSKTQGGLAFLATVGSVSPFVGLFGTVWGIYHALTAIGISGQASIDKVAGPVGEALIMTAIGLAVAVPAVLSYNWLVRRNKAVMDDVRAFSSELHAVVLGSINKT
ncbi:MotA/TolQ/ExbB proton channel family protein [Rhodoferax sp.]|uniref:MotA/TolQ/ExbB proton channel family protein n=1 Tax=Rhodoferax sp. TaxID=50421 RepID=UPI0027328FE2|nr:MotA/TolQ/ExbB proton channel family protein [Rhodoferax sp.]MDP3191626.1 MotA/TolQ/ExbB proton channel family protein [Rhodoferax sp.]MDP3864783.1 MotA/TolQ/ExbB proton channel family protein [Rhodoferax sp.]